MGLRTGTVNECNECGRKKLNVTSGVCIFCRCQSITILQSDINGGTDGILYKASAIILSRKHFICDPILGHSFRHILPHSKNMTPT